MSLQTNNIYEFEDFRLDFTEKTLRDGNGIISVTPKVFETLLAFLENPGRLIEKDELMQRLWPDRFVEESNLTFNIKMLRKALGDDAQNPRYIETVPKRGYRFIAEVRNIVRAETNGSGKENVLPIVSAPPLVSAALPPRAVSKNRAVVALADWRQEAGLSEREDTNRQFVKRDAVPPNSSINKNPKYLAIAFAVLILGSIGIASYFRFSAGDSGTIDSVAVLPFVDTTGRVGNEYLSEGISDSIINGLSQLPGLKVNSLNSVLRYKGKEVDSRTVGRELNVNAVLIGKITQHGDDIAISVELVDVRDGRRLWGELYSSKPLDILMIQGDIAQQVSNRLRLATEDTKHPIKQYTENNEAYRLYSLGKYSSRQMTKVGFAQSIKFFNQAIEIDPNYALAYTELAATYQFMMSRGFLPRAEYDQKVEWAALKALQLDGNLAEAHASLGAHKLINFDWDGAEKDIKRGLELSPNSAQANSHYGTFLTAVGRPEEALPYVNRAAELESMPGRGNVAFAFYMARQNEKAIELFQKHLEKQGNNAHPRMLLGEVYLANGMIAEGVSEMEKGISLDKTLDESPERWDRYPLLAYAYATAGRREDALKILAEQKSLAKRRYVSPYNFAIIYTGLGDKDRAFEWLAKSVEERTLIVFHLKSRPLFDSLRSDPRYADLLSKMNLSL